MEIASVSRFTLFEDQVALFVVIETRIRHGSLNRWENFLAYLSRK